ncbi:hypothetical protein DFH06DRAFT_1401531, partial [Mycena polygramma]
STRPFTRTRTLARIHNTVSVRCILLLYAITGVLNRLRVHRSHYLHPRFITLGLKHGVCSMFSGSSRVQFGSPIISTGSTLHSPFLTPTHRVHSRGRIPLRIRLECSGYASAPQPSMSAGRPFDLGPSYPRGLTFLFHGPRSSFSLGGNPVVRFFLDLMDGIKYQSPSYDIYRTEFNSASQHQFQVTLQVPAAIVHISVAADVPPQVLVDNINRDFATSHGVVRSMHRSYCSMQSHLPPNSPPVPEQFDIEEKSLKNLSGDKQLTLDQILAEPLYVVGKANAHHSSGGLRDLSGIISA